MPLLARTCLIIAAAAASLVGACASKGGSHADAPPATGLLPSDFGEWRPDAAAFAPVTIRIHPLTRITRTVARQPVLMCHVELRDRTDQVVRVLGIVQIELFPADAQGQVRDGAPPERVWQIDLREPEENAETFDDVVSRTYALSLESLPAELAHRADAPATDRDEDRREYALRVRFLFKDADGEARQLETEGPLGGP